MTCCDAQTSRLILDTARLYPCYHRLTLEPIAFCYGEIRIQNANLNKKCVSWTVDRGQKDRAKWQLRHSSYDTFSDRVRWYFKFKYATKLIS